jgi:DNA (cytosine-5)-methyltransferase 1
MTLAPDTLLDPSDLGTGLTVVYAVEGDEVRHTVRVDGSAVTRTRSVTTSGPGRKSMHTARLDTFAAWWSSYIRGERPTQQRDAQPLRYIDLFSSVGGLSLGAMEAIAALGMRGVPMLAADVDDRALQVYKRNLRPRYTATESVRGMVDFRVNGSGAGASFAYKPTVTDERLSNLAGTVDLILAGPPCQGHSSLNNHTRHEDPKNLLYLTVPAVAVAMGVSHVVIENVPNVVSDKHGVVKTTIALLRSNGYRVTKGVLAADKFGWPQTRKRFFLVASRDSEPLPLGELTHTFARETLPVSWLLQDLARKPLNDHDVMSSVPQLSEENWKRVNYLFEANSHDLPNEIRPDCHKDGHTYPATYGRMWADRPAPTITGGFLTPGRGRFIHPTERRVLTPREAARVQGFPDWFDFNANPIESPSRAEVSRWIGNAVPSLLGYVAALSALGGSAILDDWNAVEEHLA